MMDLYNTTTFECSKLITEYYSTSFTLGIKTLDKRFHFPIYAIYGFVRYADEIVDTFHGFDKKTLLSTFRDDTFKAIEDKISLNPVIHSFQMVVNEYQIDHDLIKAFLHSMEMDLYQSEYNQVGYEEYIYGSAEVVGLMCLRVFCEGNNEMYQALKDDARSLGSAFQKVNFLRDIKSDFQERGRTYFPNVDFTNFTLKDKQLIEDDIQADFDAAYRGIMNLPKGAKAGVYLAYKYYLRLFDKIKGCPASKIQNERIRVPDFQKVALLAKTYFQFRLNVL
ncbi:MULTISPECIES: phytoene/squalene synthase family protein [Bacteroidota]|jgi:phytoene/squalene synthetase|uniref:Phytoene/squalene synthase family protein n=1 Tax=Flectobacillus rivi TaxID=2984209 RepID=A0ABT6Z8W7_9BACT|nr:MULTISPECIES: phytoene/squalene synthase family protein [Bacteroidota]MDI9869895.1 phytoene/squalene synthase family protein [Flectobacillus roseus]MDI9877544.1 phytoene/squalene synthase family protein [Flectobacillus rivi]NBB30082.1 squalene/phytoene synthase family protein [Cellulophaga sp. BC115SP]